MHDGILMFILFFQSYPNNLELENEILQLQFYPLDNGTSIAYDLLTILN